MTGSGSISATGFSENPRHFKVRFIELSAWSQKDSRGILIW